MRALWVICCVMLVLVAGCREAEELPYPYTDGGLTTAPTDAGPIPDGAVGAPCPPPPEGCHPALTAVAVDDGGCVCRLPCEVAATPPRCEGWATCAPLRLQLPDGGSSMLDAGVCLPAGAPGEFCSPDPCAELLVCARPSDDAGNSCRYPCTPGPDAAVADATGADLIPPWGECPPGQRCYGMGGTSGACFEP